MRSSRQTWLSMMRSTLPSTFEGECAVDVPYVSRGCQARRLLLLMPILWAGQGGHSCHGLDKAMMFERCLCRRDVFGAGWVELHALGDGMVYMDAGSHTYAYQIRWCGACLVEETLRLWTSS
jgi:hypothetical protein